MATLSDLERLEAAYYAGVRSVQFGDRTVTYASMREMERAIDRLRAELGVGNAAGRKILAVNISPSKGLD